MWQITWSRLYLLDIIELLIWNLSFCLADITSCQKVPINKRGHFVQKLSQVSQKRLNIENTRNCLFFYDNDHWWWSWSLVMFTTIVFFRMLNYEERALRPNLSQLSQITLTTSQVKTVKSISTNSHLRRPLLTFCIFPYFFPYFSGKKLWNLFPQIHICDDHC